MEVAFLVFSVRVVHKIYIPADICELVSLGKTSYKYVELIFH